MRDDAVLRRALPLGRGLGRLIRRQLRDLPGMGLIALNLVTAAVPVTLVRNCDQMQMTVIGQLLSSDH